MEPFFSESSDFAHGIEYDQNCRIDCRELPRFVYP
jgi:hypothetical protein